MNAFISISEGNLRSSRDAVIKTYRVRLLGEGVNEDSEELIGVVDLLRVLADDPDKRRLRLRFVELVEVSA